MSINFVQILGLISRRKRFCLKFFLKGFVSTNVSNYLPVLPNNVPTFPNNFPVFPNYVPMFLNYVPVFPNYVPVFANYVPVFPNYVSVILIMCQCMIFCAAMSNVISFLAGSVSFVIWYAITVTSVT